MGGRKGLTAYTTLIGAGVVGAAVLLAIKYTTNSVFSSTMLASSGMSSEWGIEVEANDKLTVPGLQNAGNNCFLNVILQALASSRTFVSFMTACSEVTLRAEMKSLLSSTKEEVSMPLAVSVSSLMKELSQLGEAQCTSSPRHVMRALKSHVKHFDLASQQDAAEALVHLASAIQEERDNYLQHLKPAFQSFTTALLVLDRRVLNAGKSTFGGDQLLHSWRRLLQWPLEGTLASSLTCQRCAYQYTTEIQYFSDISLSPLQDQDGNIMRGCTLENCLEEFTGPEWIDSFKCSNCSHEAAVFSLSHKAAVSSLSSTFPNSGLRTSAGNQSNECAKMLQRQLKMIEECGCDDYCECEGLTRQQGGIWRDVIANASKQLKLGRSPKVVCFQIQRLVMGQDGAVKKLMGHVSFPKVLDLFPFTIAAESSPERRDVGGQNTLWLETESVSNRGSKLGHEERTETSDILYLSMGGREPLEICPAALLDCAANRKLCSMATTNTVVGDETSDGSNWQEQISNLENVPYRDTGLDPPLLSTSSGSVSTYLPSTSLIHSSSLVPRVFPRQLHTLSLFTSDINDGQQSSIVSRGKLRAMSSLNSVPQSINRCSSRSIKYSRRLLYQLVSVVVHQGGPQSGHYIVYRKMNPNQGLVVDDVPIVGQPVDEEGQDCMGETCTSRGGMGDQAFCVQLDSGVEKYKTGACFLVQTNSSSDDVPIEQSLEDQQQDGCGIPKDYNKMVSEQFVAETGGYRSRVLKQGLKNIGKSDSSIALWFRVSDTQVERVPEQEVFSAQASLLFYEQL